MADTPTEKPTRKRYQRTLVSAEQSTVRLPSGSLDRLEAIAYRQNISVGEWLRKTVLAALARAEGAANRPRKGAGK